jgi:hypothetical protein
MGEVATHLWQCAEGILSAMGAEKCDHFSNDESCMI